MSALIHRFSLLQSVSTGAGVADASGGIADNDAVIGHISGHHTPGANEREGADGNTRQNDAAGTD